MNAKVKSIKRNTCGTANSSSCVSAEKREQERKSQMEWKLKGELLQNLNGIQCRRLHFGSSNNGVKVNALIDSNA